MNSSEFVDLNVSDWLIEQCTAMGKIDMSYFPFGNPINLQNRN